MLVFMTDGLPTVGETNVSRIVDNVTKARVTGLRLFTFGVGYDVNTALLDKIAAENSGTADYVEPKEDIEIKVSNFFTKVNYPVLTDIQLDMGGIQTDLIYPRNMPDLFKGTQITIIGRYRNASDMSNVSLRLTGKAGGRPRSFSYANLSFPRTEDDNDFLPRLWATRRVGWLMEQIRTNGEQKELRDEIVDLGTRYGIVTPYTSYLALEPGAAGADVDDARPVTGGQPRPARRDKDSSSGSGGNLLGRANAPAAAQATTGAVAVQESKRARKQQESERVESEASTSAVRNVGGKTFYLRDGFWTDAEFKPEARLPETTLTFGSDEYFALLKREPRLADYFSLGERVVVVYGGRVYRINGGTK
jgi:Ca-activated chloride channel family protein